MKLEDMPKITVETPPDAALAKFKSSVEDLLARWGKRKEDGKPERVVDPAPQETKNPYGMIICITCRQRLDYEGLCGCGWEEQAMGD